MAKEATLQVRTDAELKEKMEALYRDMGASFAGAAHIFVRQSIQENGMSFVVTANKGSTYDHLSKYVDMKLATKEGGVYGRAMIGKHEKTD